MAKKVYVVVNHCYWSASGKLISESPVGARFELCKLIYEVRESESCEGCSFYIQDEGECTFKGSSCSSFSRTDGKSVKFVQVGEVV